MTGKKVLLLRPSEGYIAQYLGDGLLVYYGHPVAHEESAPRAVWAGLRMVGAVSQRNWFTVGFDTADLHEAKVLLDEVS